MRHLLSLIVFTILLAPGLALSGGGEPAYWSTPYSQRYPMIDSLAKNFPGMEHASHRGLWAGIFWQTKWQENSGRDKNPLWQYVNASLTIEPYYFAKDFLSRPGIPCERSNLFTEFPQAKSDSKIAICEKWQRYFQASQQSNIFTLYRNQKLLWDAHTSAITDALVEHEDLFADAVRLLPADEGFYWDGWVQFVYRLEKMNYLTTESNTAHISQNLLAPCFPLGSPGCEMEDLTFKQRLLAQYLMNGQGDLPSLLRLK